MTATEFIGQEISLDKFIHEQSNNKLRKASYHSEAKKARRNTLQMFFDTLDARKAESL